MEEFRVLEQAYRDATTEQQKYAACIAINDKFPAAYAFQILRVRHSENPLEEIDCALKLIPRCVEFWEFYLHYAETTPDLKDYLGDLFAAAAESIGALPESGEFWKSYVRRDPECIQDYLEMGSLNDPDDTLGLKCTNEVADALRELSKPIRHFFHPEPPSKAQSQAICAYAEALLRFGHPASDILLERLIMDNCNCEDLMLCIYASDSAQFNKYATHFRTFAKSFPGVIRLLEHLKNGMGSPNDRSTDLRVEYAMLENMINKQEIERARDFYEDVIREFTFSTPLEQEFGVMAVELISKDCEMMEAVELILSIQKTYGNNAGVLAVTRMHYLGRDDVVKQVAMKLLRSTEQREMGLFCLVALRGFS